MAHLLTRDDSDEDIQEAPEESPPSFPAQVITARAQRWYESDSEDEDTGAGRPVGDGKAKSREERRAEEIDHIADQIEYLIIEGEWSKGLARLRDVIKLTSAFMDSRNVDAREAPKQLRDYIEHVLNHFDEYQKVNNPKERKARASVEKLLRDLQTTIAVVAQEEAPPPTEPVADLSAAEAFVRKVMGCDTPSKLSSLLQSKAPADLPRHVHAYAAAALASSILATGQELVALQPEALQHALEWASTSLKTVQAEHLAVDTTVRGEGELPFDPANTRRTYVAGGFEGLVQSLYTHWLRSLQDHSIHSDQRQAALRNEHALVRFAERLLEWAASRRTKAATTWAALTLLRLIAPMSAAHYAETVAEPQCSRWHQLRTCEKLKELVASPPDDIRREVVLLLAYVTAHIGDFRAAKEACLKEPTLADPVAIPVHHKILLNRCAVAVALGAFRSGALRETVDGLKDLLARDRRADFAWAVLIGQGRPAHRFLDNPNVTETDHLRAIVAFYDFQVPVHHIIDTTSVIKAFLISCILTLYRQEKEPASDRLRDDAFLPTYYFEFLRQSRRNVFPKPPQTVEELCNAFRAAIHRGDGREALALLVPLKLTYPPLLEATTDAALRNYAERLGANFTCVSVSFLASRFDVDVAVMRRMLVRLICEGSLSGQLDDADDIVYCEPPTSDVRKLVSSTARALFSTESSERTGGRSRGRGRGGRIFRAA